MNKIAHTRQEGLTVTEMQSKTFELVAEEIVEEIIDRRFNGLVEERIKSLREELLDEVIEILLAQDKIYSPN